MSRAPKNTVTSPHSHWLLQHLLIHAVLRNTDSMTQGTDHPSVILRFRETVKLFQMGERSVGLQNAAYVLKALLDPATSAPPHETAKDYFDWVSSRLETLYGTKEQTVDSTRAD
jgi:hypothetical protein